MTTISLAFFAVIPVVFMTLSSIECVRQGDGDEGICHVRERGLLNWRTRDFPLRDLKALRVDEHTDSDNDTLSRLLLVTTDGEVPLGSGSDNMDMSARHKVAAQFAEFRQGHAPRFEATVGYGGIAFAVIWAAVCALFAAIGSGRSVRIVIDPSGEAIRVRRWFRTIDLPLSRDIRLVSEKDSEGDDKWLLVSPTRQIPLPNNVRIEDITAFDRAVEAALADPRESGAV